MRWRNRGRATTAKAPATTVSHGAELFRIVSSRSRQEFDIMLPPWRQRADILSPDVSADEGGRALADCHEPVTLLTSGNNAERKAGAGKIDRPGFARVGR